MYHWTRIWFGAFAVAIGLALAMLALFSDAAFAQQPPQPFTPFTVDQQNYQAVMEALSNLPIRDLGTAQQISGILARLEQEAVTKKASKPAASKPPTAHK